MCTKCSNLGNNTDAGIVKVGPNQSTSNLQSHSRHHHPKEYETICTRVNNFSRFRLRQNVGIGSFHSDLPFIKANDLTAIAPLPTNLICPLAIGTFPNWLDDVYLNSQVWAPNISSRFTKSEDYPLRLDPTHPPRQSDFCSNSCQLQPGPMQRSAPSNIIPIFGTLTTTDDSHATRCKSTLLLWTTLSIAIKILSVCPPPHNPCSIKIPIEDLLVWSHKILLSSTPLLSPNWERSSTSHHHIEPNSIQIIMFPTKTHSTTLTLLAMNHPISTLQEANTTTHTTSSCPPNTIHLYPTMPT